MSKPREFWIKPGEHSEGFPWHPEQNSWNDDFYSCVSENKFDDGIKVIEYSAYEDLKAKHERVLQALEIAERSLIDTTKNARAAIEYRPDMITIGGFDFVLSKIESDIDQALAQIQELKK